MAVLYYHRMLEGFPEPLYQSVSYAAGYSKRAFVLTTPHKGDHVLIDPSAGMDLSFPEIGLLNEQGLGPDPEKIHVVDFDHTAGWQENASRNRAIIDQLKNDGIEAVYPFTGKSRIVHALARECGAGVRTSACEETFWAEDKKTLLDLAHLAPVPFGYKVRDNAELYSKWQRLCGRSTYTGTAVVKASQSASGVTSTIVRSAGHLQSFTDVFDLGALCGGVIEEWHESDPRSPSINYFIYPDGRCKVLFVSDQIFEDGRIVYGREGTRVYRGNRFPSTFDSAIQQRIAAGTLPLAEELYRHGYWGPVGFDTIVIGRSTLLITEINPRITGPHFGWRPMKNLGLSCFSLQNEEVRKDTGFGSLRDALEEVLYYPGKTEGYIILNFFPGKFIGVVVAAREDAMDEMKDRAAEKLRPLRRTAGP